MACRARTWSSEITENLLMAEPRAPEILSQLRSLGPRIAVDDFGTGYSSLAYLKDLAHHRAEDRPCRLRKPGVRFAQALLRSLAPSSASLAISASRTVAEGVETLPLQADFLRALGCTA